MNITRNPIYNAVWSGYMNTPFETSVVALFSTDVGLRTALFWAVTQRVVVIPYRRCGTTYRSRLSTVKNQRFLTLDEGTDSFPETSVRNCHYALRNSPEERSSHLRGWSLKSRIAWVCLGL